MYSDSEFITSLGSHPSIFVDVAKRLRSRRNEIKQAIQAAIQREVPGPLVDDRDYEAGVYSAITALLDFSLDAIEGGPGWQPNPHPPEVTAQARRAARNGVSLGVVMRRCLVGHRVFAGFIEEEIEAVASEDIGSALRCMRRIQESLLTHLTASTEHEYNEEVTGVGLVESLLAGGPVDLSTLDYEIDDRWHLGVVATSARADEVLQSAGRHFGCTIWSVLGRDATLWVWFGGPEPLVSADLESVINEQAPTQVRLAAGEPGRGLSGWRMTHQQAREALGVAGYHGKSLTRFAEVALVALLQDRARI